jgi:isoleucyl-tRNA synthetase
LCRYPEANQKLVSRDLENQMSLVQKVVYMGRTIRNTNRLKTRQPLKEFLVITRNPGDQKTIESFSGLIASELNVKNVTFTNQEEKWVKLTAKANAKILGPKLGTKMKVVLQRIKELPHEEVAKLERDGKLTVEGENVTLEDVVVERAPKQEGLIQSQGGVTVWFDTQLNDELIQEGLARELVNRIQKLRKDLGFEVTDRILVEVATTDELMQAFKKFETYISDEVLANHFLVSIKTSGFSSEQDIEGSSVKLWITKAP